MDKKSTLVHAQQVQVRSHWAVENALHWSLDVSFAEDACRVRKDEGPANGVCVRRFEPCVRWRTDALLTTRHADKLTLESTHVQKA
jgi:hypothetical protein